VTGIDDHYMNYAHRHELSPGFSADDDIPDPYVPGEIPGREWVVPNRSRSRKRNVVATPLPHADRGGSWESSARRWLAAFPEGTNRQCQRALLLAGHKKVGTKFIQRLRASIQTPAPTSKRARTKRTPAAAPRVGSKQRSSRSASRRQVAELDWQSFATRWLGAHPGMSNRQWQEAITEAGYIGVTAAALTRIRNTVAPVRRAPRRPAVVVRSASRPVLGVEVRYCDGCGLAVGYDGRCRC
jgi:hypothetical protein